MTKGHATTAGVVGIGTVVAALAALLQQPDILATITGTQPVLAGLIGLNSIGLSLVYAKLRADRRCSDCPQDAKAADAPSGRSAGPVGLPSLLIVVLALATGCGHSFVAQKSATLDLVPLAPSSAVLSADGAEVCRLSNPTGDLPIAVTCDAGAILWADQAGRIIRCAPFACPTGSRPDYSQPGVVQCR